MLCNNELKNAHGNRSASSSRARKREKNPLSYCLFRFKWPTLDARSACSLLPRTNETKRRTIKQQSINLTEKKQTPHQMQRTKEAPK